MNRLERVVEDHQRGIDHHRGEGAHLIEEIKVLRDRVRET